jgi:tetratricopeptide (TPR) repeat protein
MRFCYIAIFLMLFAVAAHANGSTNIDGPREDTTTVKQLNKHAYDARFTNAEETINGAGKALILAMKLGYTPGIAEAYRVQGIGKYYLNLPEDAINSYIQAITYFEKCGDKIGEANVDNNIGNLYRDNDYDRSLEYFQKALDIGNALHSNVLIGKSYLNFGNLCSRKMSYTEALKDYTKSKAIFSSLGDSVDLILCEQNSGVVYCRLNQLDIAEKLLTDASTKARDKDLNEAVASTDLTLAEVYIKENKFADASRIVTEGQDYAGIIKDEKLLHDFLYTSYELEAKRKNYEKALSYLVQVYRGDSLLSKTSLSSQINIFEVKHKQEEQLKENELIDQQNQYERVRFWMATAVVGLLVVVIGLLVSNVKRKAKTNLQLTELNGEVSRQKDNLDRVNHHLEEIIDERTKDLQIKNRKLSEYSSYLSHQIRGPIATLKGLMNLEKEGLVNKQECINMMDKCVSEIDEKIIEMSDMMHNPERSSI